MNANLGFSRNAKPKIVDRKSRVTSSSIRCKAPSLFVSPPSASKNAILNLRVESCTRFRCSLSAFS